MRFIITESQKKQMDEIIQDLINSELESIQIESKIGEWVKWMK